MGLLKIRVGVHISNYKMAKSAWPQLCNLQLNYLFRYLERFTNLYTKLFCILLLWTAVGHFNPALSAAFLMASSLLQASQLLYRVFIKYCGFFKDFKIYSRLWPLC